MAFFSIVIPLYNKENFIENTIKSVLNQSFTDYELIIIDDCSSDNSLKIASQFIDDRIIIINHENNKGLSASRNTGIRNSNSKYVAFLDADDLWKNNFLEEIYTLINTYLEASLFATNFEEIITTKIIVLPTNGSEKLDKNSVIDDFFLQSLQQPLYCPSGFCAKKEVFDKVGFYNEKITFGEDVDFNIRANLEFKLAYSTQPLVQYFVNSENQITQSKLSSKILTDFAYYEKKYPNKSLKKFLDFQRYTKIRAYKSEHNFEVANKLKKEIDLSNLNWKQKILLYSPRFILNLVKSFKLFLLQKGIRITTYK